MPEVSGNPASRCRRPARIRLVAEIGVSVLVARGEFSIVITSSAPTSPTAPTSAPSPPPSSS